MHLDTKTYKNVVILEGADACGKSELAKYLQSYVEGKCHTLHSNFDPQCKGKCNLRQHKNIYKYIKNQFSKKYYTGNRLVILDRSIISDIVYYGTYGFGSPYSKDKKTELMLSWFKNLIKDNIDVSIIFCNPSTSKDFNLENKEELINKSELAAIKEAYNDFFYIPYTSDDKSMFNVLRNIGVSFFEYDYITDPSYEKLIANLNCTRS